jgi:CheY-like chemotaxis protein
MISSARGECCRVKLWRGQSGQTFGRPGGLVAPEKRPALVVDDESEAREVLRDFFALSGLSVLEAKNGLEALLQVKHNRPAVVVLDLNMPRLGGLDTLRRIRSFDPTIKIAVVTGDLDAVVHQRARAMGAVVVLTKPVDLLQLGAALGLAPAERPAIAPAPPPAPPSPEAPPRSRPGRILIVDDDAEVRTTLEEFLADRGYQTSAVPDGAAALRALAGTRPDVVLLDIEMPRLSGIEALPHIRAVAPETRVIMVSATASVETAKQALALGAFDYVLKPVDFDYLLSSLEAALLAKGVGL